LNKDKEPERIVSIEFICRLLSMIHLQFAMVVYI